MLGRQLIDESKISLAQAEFKKWPGSVKSRLDFNQWLEWFSQPSISFREIALRVREMSGGEINCTRQAVQQLYSKHFAPLFPNWPDGRSRRRFYTAEKQLNRASDFSQAPEILRRVAEAAREKGLKVRRVILFSEYGKENRFSSHSLIINGERCDVRRMRRAWKVPRGKSHYGHISVSISSVRNYGFLIVLQEIEGYPQRTFVIPMLDILKAWGKANKAKVLYIPLDEGSAYKKIFPKFDFRRYVDAWHLLKKQTEH